MLQRIWSQAHAIEAGDEADAYLKGRGLYLSHYPATLRCHPALAFFERGTDGDLVQTGRYVALVARVDDVQGQMCALHRTWLLQQGKLPHRDCRKLLGSARGGAVRLGEASHVLALAEGIETALAVQLLTGTPVWAALSAGNIERLQLPPDVEHLAIYGDNDRGFQGQYSAYALARRLLQEGKAAPRSVDVLIPAVAGQDWADVWSCSRQQTTFAATG